MKVNDKISLAHVIAIYFLYFLKTQFNNLVDK